MLTFVVDALHEDLNRVKDKPYTEIVEKQNEETDSEASARWWKNHLLRENSIIVDLFHGQYKSKITCPECKRISITYDPFMYLGLPIPSESCRIKFKFFPDDLNFSYIEFDLGLSDKTNVNNMKSVICQNRKIEMKNLEAIKVKEMSFKQIVKDDLLITQLYEQNYEIIIYEKKKDIDYLFTFYVTPVELVEETKLLVLKKKVEKTLFYVKPFYFGLKTKVRDLYKEIFVYYRKLLDDFVGHEYDNFKNNLTNDNYIEQEFKFYVYEKKIIKLRFNNNVPLPNSWFSSKEPCEFCNQKCNQCSLPLDDDNNNYLSKYYQCLKNERCLIISAELISSRRNTKKLFKVIPEISNLLTKKKGVVSIYDCLESFSKEEQLESENSWYCSNCQKHQEAYKKLEIYRPPNILIVQFKRFKIRSTGSMSGFFANRKNESLIDYPISNFDITKYVVGEKGESYIYDLFAISLHFGGMSSGHYTALAKNNGMWIEYDDDRTSKADTSDILTNNAYLLFYKRRNMSSITN